MIQIHLLHRQGGFRLHVDIELEAQGIIGLIGRSGSGKSTLFNCLAGHIRPDRGCITLNGRRLFDSTDSVNLSPARRKIGVVFQDGLLFPHMTVEKNLFYGAGRTTEGFADEVIEALDIRSLMNRKPARLSGGERQRTAIGRALMAQPDLLLLDEPVSALDPGLKARTLDLIARVQQATGTPMIYISHGPEEVRRLCDRVITLQNGEVAAISDPDGRPLGHRPRLATAEDLQCAM